MVTQKSVRKLVRDNIPEMIRQRGVEPDIFVATDEEYGTFLKEKLVEEVHEFLESETVEELGDILEVIEALCAWKEFTPTQLKEVKEHKLQERGGFSKKYVATFSAPL